MKKIWLVLSFCFSCFLIGGANAEESDAFYINSLNFCQKTKPGVNDYEPETFAVTNNLLRKTGGQVKNCGKKIIIRGRVLDENCVPVSDAKVYLWQIGCDGKYPYKPLKPKVDPKLVNLDSKTSFQGSGTATTDNNGVFYFITILPPSQHPQGHIRINHYKLGNLQTNLVLSRSNVLDEPMTSNENVSNLTNDYLTYNFDLVMPGLVNKGY